MWEWVSVLTDTGEVDNVMFRKGLSLSFDLGGRVAPIKHRIIEIASLAAPPPQPAHVKLLAVQPFGPKGTPLRTVSGHRRSCPKIFHRALGISCTLLQKS